MRCGVRGDGGDSDASDKNQSEAVQRTTVGSSSTETGHATAGHRRSLRVGEASRMSGVGVA